MVLKVKNIKGEATIKPSNEFINPSNHGPEDDGTMRKRSHHETHFKRKF